MAEIQKIADSTVTKKTKSDEPQVSSIRELFEAVAVAFILAFIVRTFLIEAFIIPTGSMAPTLMGRHNDIKCPKCQYEYRCGSPEIGDNRENECPNCRNVLPLEPKNLDHQTYNGDKIVVNKFIYDFSAPQRFDVIVFKFPEDSKTNYIKRLVGLPGETLTIKEGEIYIYNEAEKQFKIERKPNAKKMQAMLQDVYNNDFLYKDFVQKGWPLHWQNWSVESSKTQWAPQDEGISYSIESAPAETAWLRYQHFVPDQNDWSDFDNKRTFKSPSPKLITDNYAYNYNMRHQILPNNVGDLALECTLNATNPDGTVTFELVRGGQQFQAIANLKTGAVQLSIPALPNFKPVSRTSPFTANADHKILFANVDRKLWLVIDGKPVEFDSEPVYDLADIDNPVTTTVQPGSNVVSDLAPVGIGVSKSTANVKHLRVLRDVYYTDKFFDNPKSIFIDNHFQISLVRNPNKPDDDQFFMCGDNSPSSLDGRLWTQQPYVERRHLIGKATYVFWPHSWPTGISRNFDVGLFNIDIPFWPNFERMRLIK